MIDIEMPDGREIAEKVWEKAIDAIYASVHPNADRFNREVVSILINFQAETLLAAAREARLLVTFCAINTVQPAERLIAERIADRLEHIARIVQERKRVMAEPKFEDLIGALDSVTIIRKLREIDEDRERLREKIESLTAELKQAQEYIAWFHKAAEWDANAQSVINQLRERVEALERVLCTAEHLVNLWADPDSSTVIAWKEAVRKLLEKS